MLRATWTAAEILSDFQHDVASFELEMGGGGDFELTIDDRLVYSKRSTGEYPDIRTLKQAVADAIEAKPTA